jgi:hypothetical protein
VRGNRGGGPPFPDWGPSSPPAADVRGSVDVGGSFM